MNGAVNIVITGLGLALPGVETAGDLLGRPDPSAAPVDPAARLGKKGLRYKDRATQLALCAAADALREAALPEQDGPDVAVVVSSNLGNVDTVCRVIRTLDEETSRGLSPMDTPSLSSNVIASELAIRFGLRGPNLTVCSGETAGLDAVRWALTLLRAGRAGAVLVVGVEPDNDDVRALTGAPRLVDGGAALVLETGESAQRRGVRALAAPHHYVRTDDPAPALRAVAGEPGLTLRAETTDPGWGAMSGALGVVQCATAVGWFAGGHREPVHALAGGAGLVLTATP
ncbi:beta-ketoacyl synthase N-terminal-like domain-containing protein [Actinophytocola xinjiangensis]|uniref:beta-ketoacyl synthase N-terminal-like domain-containing protein n=1 Tax=Actinophytocola xinjiangensis TaxID=485602 RepID=UPI000AC96E2C|nr:beta-ketoacyl synthase N-terminal-like domain-containing protein [Actinophytocola xinjiangensis]